MLSNNYSRSPSGSLEAHQALAPELGAPRTEAPLLRLARRVDIWLAVMTVLVTTWASWLASNWLLQGWQIH